MKVLIVAKTHMKNAFCVGAYDITSKANIRLLTSSEDNQPTNTKFNVGQLWEMEYIKRATIIPPHVEEDIIEAYDNTEVIKGKVFDYLRTHRLTELLNHVEDFTL